MRNIVEKVVTVCIVVGVVAICLFWADLALSTSDTFGHFYH